MGVPPKGLNRTISTDMDLATILPGAPRTLTTNFALGTPGNAATYKVYVLPSTGNERGSNPVTVQRPG